MGGVRIMFSTAVNGEFFRGSSVKTSSAAPATRPCLTACARAASSTSSPRGHFTSRPPSEPHMQGEIVGGGLAFLQLRQLDALLLGHRSRDKRIVRDDLHAEG